MSTAKAVIKPVVVKSELASQETLDQVEQGMLLKNAILGYHEIVNACLLSHPDFLVLERSLEILQTDIEQRVDEVFKLLCA